MSAMTPFDNFDQVLSDFDKVEERQFLINIREFAEKFPEVVIKTFSVLLKNQALNFQLKYLILKSGSELGYPGLIPALKEVLQHEKNVQIITEAINGLAAIGSLSAYKVIIEFIKRKKGTEYRKKIEQSLKSIFIRNQLVYYFDILYCDRGDAGNIEKSSEFLIKHLSDDHVKDLLVALTSRFNKIRVETLRIIKHRPKPIYYSTIYYFFKENAPTADDELFLEMSEALINCASLSTTRMKIFQKLKIHLTQLEGDKRNVFCIVLLKLNTRETIPCAIEIYPELNFDRKLLLLEYLNPDDFRFYPDFLRNLLNHEDNQIVLAKIVEILIYAGDYKYLFETIDLERGVRKHKLLNMILEQAPDKIDDYLKKYITPAQENQILLSVVAYLLNHDVDNYFELITGVFFSGVSPEIKVLILRDINKFESHRQKLFIESILNDLQVVRDLKKDFLTSLLNVVNKKIFDEEMEGKILNQVLVLMEEAAVEEIVNFVDFFDKYTMNKKRDCKLIIDELRLVRETIIKAGIEPNLVRNINVLTRKIEEKMKLKRIPKKSGI